MIKDLSLYAPLCSSLCSFSEPGDNGGGAGFTGLSEPGDHSGGLVEYGLVGEAARSISEGSGAFIREKLQDRVQDA